MKDDRLHIAYDPTFSLSTAGPAGPNQYAHPLSHLRAPHRNAILYARAQTAVRKPRDLADAFLSVHARMYDPILSGGSFATWIERGAQMAAA